MKKKLQRLLTSLNTYLFYQNKEDRVKTNQCDLVTCQQQELTEEIFNAISPNDVIYGEVSASGAMGCPGQAFLCVKQKGIAVRYDTYISDILYDKIDELLFGNSQRIEASEDYVNPTFNYYYGGFGNHVFINSSCHVVLSDYAFIIKDHTAQYHIKSSVLGVFASVAKHIETGKSPFPNELLEFEKTWRQDKGKITARVFTNNANCYTKELLTHLSGVIFGAVVGDALGLSAEFMTREAVQQNYPNGIRGYDDCVRDRHRIRWKRAEWTDDTEMMLCIHTTPDGIDLLKTAENFVHWLNSGARGVGTQTFRVLSFPQYAPNAQKTAEWFWRQNKEQSAPNGGVMRTAILSVIYVDREFEFVARQSEELCKLTHYDPRCVGSCVILNFVLWKLLHDETPSRNEIMALADRYDSRITPYINPIWDNSHIETLKLDEPNAMGYTLKCLSAALWALVWGYSFESALRIIIEQGGDADTNGTVAGAVLGAKFGLDAIPTHWQKPFVQEKRLWQIIRPETTFGDNL